MGALGGAILLSALLRPLSMRWGWPCDAIVKAPWHTTVLKNLDSVGTAVDLGCPHVVTFGAGHPDGYRLVGPPEIARFVAAPHDHDWPGDHARFAAVHRIEDITVDQVVDAWQQPSHRSRRLPCHVRHERASLGTTVHSIQALGVRERRAPT